MSVIPIYGTNSGCLAWCATCIKGITGRPHAVLVCPAYFSKQLTIYMQVIGKLGSAIVRISGIFKLPT